MIIYVSHSKNFDFQNELYQPLKNSSLSTEHMFALPYEDNETPFVTKDFFESGQCNLVLAEVSFESTAQGIELGWAEMLHIPIICIYKLDAQISESLFLISNKFIEYLDSDDMIKRMTKALRFFEEN